MGTEGTMLEEQQSETIWGETSGIGGHLGGG